MLELNTASPRLGQWACGLFPALRSVDPVAALRTYIELTEQATTIAQTMQDPRYPVCVAVRSGSTNVIVINCTETLGQAASLFGGYAYPVRDRTGSRVVNAQLTNAAAFYFQNGLNATLEGSASVLIVGHSQGGAIAPWLAELMKDARSTLNIKVISFGAPKVGGTHYVVRQGTKFEIVRYMNEGDPIPSFPYVGGNRVATELPIPRSVHNMSQFDQHFGGRLVSDTGGIRASIDTSSPDLIPNLADFGAWLWNTEAGNVTPHTIAVYQSRLAMFNASNPLPQQQAVPVGGRPLVVNVPQVEVNRQVNEHVQNVFRIGAQQQAEPVIIPPTEKFKAVHDGRMWGVQFGDTLIAIGPTKRRCLHLARSLNDAFTTAQHQAFFDPNGFVQKLQAYFNLAVAPGNGFQPIMQDELPMED